MNDISLTNYYNNYEGFSQLKTNILKWLRDHPKAYTTEEIALFIDQPLLRVRPRITDLKKEGLIVLHDKVRYGSSTHGRYKLK